MIEKYNGRPLDKMSANELLLKRKGGIYQIFDTSANIFYLGKSIDFLTTFLAEKQALDLTYFPDVDLQVKYIADKNGTPWLEYWVLEEIEDLSDKVLDFALDKWIAIFQDKRQTVKRI